MIYLFLGSIVLFFAVYLFERRTIWLGSLFWLMMLMTYLYVLSKLPYPWSYITILPIILTMVVGPVVFGILCLYKSFQLLHRERRRWSNFLSLGLGIVAILLVFSYSYLNLYTKIEQQYGLLIPYVVFTFLVLYLLMQLVFFTTAALLNNLHLFPRKLNVVIVLGAGLNGDKVTPLLASRINKGISLYRKSSGSKLIMSGGQGSDELISEAEAMRNYAISQGVPEQDIWLEKKSRNTRENLRFSKELVPEGAKIAIVTSYYHLFRALTLSRKEKISCIGYVWC
ncbi:YdcF family protein [Streptococcus dentiloxodontae]